MIYETRYIVFIIVIRNSNARMIQYKKFMYEVRRQCNDDGNSR